METSDAWIRVQSERELNFKGKILFNEPLSNHVYYKIGGYAEMLAFPESIEDLKLLKSFILENSLPVFFFGMGSNVLISDKGVPGVSIKLSKLSQTLTLESPNIIHSGCSVSVNSFLRFAAKEGVGGLEFLSGVPGNIGGAIAMNAGTHLGESSSALISFRSFCFFAEEKSEIKTFSVTHEDFSYRKNHLWKNSEIIIDSEWQGKPDTTESVKRIIDETFKRRKETQPLEYPSCGSVFKNPIGTQMKAWEVIEKCGLRGLKIGGAQISEKHPNWIVNLGQANSTDVWGLIEKCMVEAKTQFNIVLEPEVHWVGDR